METFYFYKGYGVRYSELSGTTFVEKFGFAIETFEGIGFSEGKRLAEELIDNITSKRTSQ